MRPALEGESSLIAFPMYSTDSGIPGQVWVRISSLSGCPGMPEPVEHTNHLASIIAVHGLNGHRRDTWTYTDNDERTVLWLKDLLLEKMLTARIMTFSYNAKAVGCTSTNDINDNAGVPLRELLISENLAHLRERLIGHRTDFGHNRLALWGLGGVG